MFLPPPPHPLFPSLPFSSTSSSFFPPSHPLFSFYSTLFLIHHSLPLPPIYLAFTFSLFPPPPSPPLLLLNLNYLWINRFGYYSTHIIFFISCKLKFHGQLLIIYEDIIYEVCIKLKSILE